MDSAFSDYVFVHEFGHHFAALADEYYTSDVAYQTGASDLPEPWEPNVTALKDPATLKWRDLVEPGTPLPHAVGEGALRSGEPRDTRTAPRDQGAQRPETEMDALFRAERERDERELGAERFARKVGAFEGASYEPRGLYRPEVDCIMSPAIALASAACVSGHSRAIIDLYAR